MVLDEAHNPTEEVAIYKDSSDELKLWPPEGTASFSKTSTARKQTLLAHETIKGGH